MKTTMHRNSRSAWMRPIQAIVLALAMTLVGTAGGALAQNNEIQALTDAVRRLQGDLQDLQREVYGEAVPERAAGAEAVAAPADNRQAERAGQVEVRLAGLEGELRKLTGDIERVGHDVDQTRIRLENLVEDVDFRLRAIENQLAGLVAGQQGGGAPGAAATPNPALGAATPVGPGPGPDAVQSPVVVLEGGDPGAAGAQVLGVLPAEGPDNVGIQIQPSVLDILPQGTPDEQYAFAYGLLQQFRIVEAEQAFAEFVLVNPNDDLTANAQYWLGETFYVRGMYQQAALTFFEGYQEKPTGTKASDNLLKLGMSLARMDQRTEACATLSELSKQFPDANQTVTEQAVAERTRLECP